MSESRVVTVERLVRATPDQVFDVITDPRRHAELDGSGMVRGAADAPERLGPGDDFRMDMKQFVGYRSVNTVVEYERDRLLTWETVGRWRGRRIIGGQRWRYRLTPDGDHTRVEHAYLWGEARFALLVSAVTGFPKRMGPAMAGTLERLDTALAGR